jgi:hypothetical protein
MTVQSLEVKHRRTAIDSIFRVTIATRSFLRQWARNMNNFNINLEVGMSSPSFLMVTDGGDGYAEEESSRSAAFEDGRTPTHEEALDFSYAGVDFIYARHDSSTLSVANGLDVLSRTTSETIVLSLTDFAGRLVLSESPYGRELIPQPTSSPSATSTAGGINYSEDYDVYDAVDAEDVAFADDVGHIALEDEDRDSGLYNGNDGGSDDDDLDEDHGEDDDEVHGNYHDRDYCEGQREDNEENRDEGCGDDHDEDPDEGNGEEHDEDHDEDQDSFYVDDDYDDDDGDDSYDDYDDDYD